MPEKKCAHPTCRCHVQAGDEFCSDYCRSDASRLDPDCRCGHPDCR